MIAATADAGRAAAGRCRPRRRCTAPAARRAPARPRPGDQLPGLLPGQAHAALRGVHRLGDPEPVRPQVVAEADRGLPVDALAAAAADGGDVGGRVDAARGRRRVAGRPARIGDDQRLARRRAAGSARSSPQTASGGHVDPAALGRGLQRQLGQLHALGALGQVPGERPALPRRARNSSHCTLNPLSKVMLSGTSVHCAR